MTRPKCAVKSCQNDGLVLYGINLICGECLTKIMKKEVDRKSKLLEELE